jgi:hypothetical protein
MRPHSKARGGRILEGSMVPTGNKAVGDAAADECKNYFFTAT